METRWLRRPCVRGVGGVPPRQPEQSHPVHGSASPWFLQPSDCAFRPSFNCLMAPLRPTCVSESFDLRRSETKDLIEASEALAEREEGVFTPRILTVRQ